MKSRIDKQMVYVIAIALAALAVAVAGASGAGDKSPTIPSSLAHVQEPGSTSDFDTYSFQEPTGVYDTAVVEPGAAGNRPG